MLRRTLVLLNQAASTSSSSSRLTGPRSFLSHLDPTSLQPLARTLERTHKNLYQSLALLPRSGVGAKLRQTRWAAKGLDLPADDVLRGPPGDKSAVKKENHLCYWEITKVNLKPDGKHGQAWGNLIWRGKRVTPEGKAERIPGALKYTWDLAR